MAILLQERKETVSVAETVRIAASPSCPAFFLPANLAQAAGGLLSAALLSFPGASGYYQGGLTLYTLESRKAFAGWTEAYTHDYTGPTPDIVSQLAEHTRTTLGSTDAVGESGPAGPTGGQTRNRIPGYVALAVAVEGKETVTREVASGSSDRAANMVRFAWEGLALLRDVIKGGGRL